MGRLRETLEFVKFPHTLFALPFAAIGAAYAAGGLPRGREILWILLAMVGARTAAMAFNRIVDRAWDARNPRTADRALPRGRLTVRYAAVLCAGALAVFFVSAAMLNRVVLALSPVAAAVILGYSFAKRFTAASHFWLGLGLGLAPVGAWLAIRSEPLLAPLPLFLGAGVLFWVAGFDILYACEDAEFDRREGLRSIPAAVGIPAALRIAAGCHAAAAGLLAAPLALGAGPPGLPYGIAVGAVAALLVVEHAMVRPGDLRRVQAAFFHVNVAIGLILMTGTFLDVAIR